MKKFFASVVVGLLVLVASPVFAQEGIDGIKKLIREQEILLATMRLQTLHFEITHATDRALRAFEAYRGLEKKISKFSNDPAVYCAKQLPTTRDRQTIREVQTSTALVVELMDKAAPLIAAGGTPSEGMKKLLEGDLMQLMQTIAADGAKLQSLLSDLETSCSKEG